MAKKTNPSVVATDIYEQFENANAFKSSINLINDIKRSVLFENGKQWNMDEDIKEFPKITINIIKQIGKARKSGIMANDYSYLVNSTNFQSIRKIQDFLKYLAQCVEIRQKDLKVLSDDYTKGTGIMYFYWDAEKRGFMKKSGGEMRAEVVDIRNFAVANPYIQSIQEQEWVMYVTREKISALKQKYGDKNYVADGNLYTAGTEVENISTNFPEDDLVNVFTKFFRNEEGQVFFTIATQYEVLKTPTPLNPYYKGPSKEMPNTTSLPDEKSESKDAREDKIWNLYPFAKLSLNERDNCFYGMPITHEYIEAQKSINNHYSVYDKAIQDNVLGGFVFRKGVVDSNEVTTENGQMLELDTMPNEPIANAFGRLPVANVPADSATYSNNLINLTRQVAGASNVQLGMSDFAGQSGKQTQMLLQRAQENSSDNAMMFNEYKREQAKIMFLFAKFFYDNESFVLINHGAMKDDIRSYQGPEAFNGTQYLDDDVMIDIRVGAAPSFSEYTNIELLGLMVQSGQAPFETYVAMLPEGYISNKQEIIELAKNNSNVQIKQMQQQLEQANLVMEQMSKAYQKTQKDMSNIDTIIQENIRLKSMMAEISANAIQKVSQADQQTLEATQDVRKLLQSVGRTTTDKKQKE